MSEAHLQELPQFALERKYETARPQSPQHLAVVTQLLMQEADLYTIEAQRYPGDKDKQAKAEDYHIRAEFQDKVWRLTVPGYTHATRKLMEDAFQYHSELFVATKKMFTTPEDIANRTAEYRTHTQLSGFYQRLNTRILQNP